MRMLLHSPKDAIAGGLAFVAAAAIVGNALFLQAGRHPSPMFGTVTTLPAPGPTLANPLPHPRPAEASGRTVEPTAAPAPRSAEAKTADPKIADPMTSLVVKATGGTPAAPNVTRPPVPIAARGAAASRRVAAVQRALTEYGYGQLKPTGNVNADTQAAIQKFERDRKLPVTGLMSERLVKELAATIGHPIE